jgi:hypothetical protein
MQHQKASIGRNFSGISRDNKTLNPTPRLLTELMYFVKQIITNSIFQLFDIFPWKPGVSLEADTRWLGDCGAQRATAFLRQTEYHPFVRRQEPTFGMAVLQGRTTPYHIVSMGTNYPNGRHG